MELMFKTMHASSMNTKYTSYDFIIAALWKMSLLIAFGMCPGMMSLFVFTGPLISFLLIQKVTKLKIKKKVC